MENRTLRNTLKVARARMNCTQAELADAVGVTRKTINSIENMRYVPSTYLALLIARELNTTVEELFRLPEKEGT
jgi:putative transcriptional regulator